MSTPTVVNVSQHLPEMADEQPGELALRVPKGRGRPGDRISYSDFTFRELNSEVDARAHWLVSKGITRGMRVLMLVRPGLELTALFFSLFKIGAVPVLIDPGMGLRGFLRCVETTKPQALLAIPQGIWLSRILRRPFTSVRFRIQVGNTPLSVNQASGFPVVGTAAEDQAAILFTSGSTGPAKGVCYEHRMFAAQVELIRNHYEIEPGEIDLPMLPVFALFNPALGMATVIPEINPSRPATVEPARIVQAIRQCEVTNSFGAPILWRKIGRYCQDHGIQLPSIRRILMAGAPVAPAVLRDFEKILPHGEVHTPYGATECLPVSSHSGKAILSETSAYTERGEGTCVGRVFEGVDVKVIEIFDGPIVDEQEMKEVLAGTIGEIVVRGPIVTKEYDRLPEATRDAKIPGQNGLWHRIGDVGYFDSQYRLWFCGRKADRVRTPNGTLFTDCCEAIFNRHPQVARSALIGLGEPGRATPAIVVEPEPGRYPRGAVQRGSFIEELRELGAKVEATREIETFFFAKSFPVDVRHNAKIHRQTLAKRFGARRGQ